MGLRGLFYAELYLFKLSERSYGFHRSSGHADDEEENPNASYGILAFYV